jgi:hypothetical protein
MSQYQAKDIANLNFEEVKSDYDISENKDAAE